MTCDATVVDVCRLTPQTEGFRPRVPGHRFDFEPGHHTTVRFGPGDGTAVRPYTPTSLPGTDELTLTIRRDDGLASADVHTRWPGDEVTVGPLEGDLALADTGRDVASLAGGTGTTPMLSVPCRHRREGSGHTHAVGGETRSHPPRDAERTGGRRPRPRGDGRAVRPRLGVDPGGGVQGHLGGPLGEFQNRDFYVCGVPSVVVETKEQLRDLGAPEERVHSEGREDGVVADD